jgi:tetratricopeptide (TPR) repeat protein
MENHNPSPRDRGIQALRDGDFAGASILLAHAVMADGQDAEALAFLGVAHSRQGQHDEARRALQSAVELQPQEARFRFNLGVALESADDPQGAAAAYREALSLKPDHTQARARLQTLEGQIAPGHIPAVPPSMPETDTTAGAWQAGWQPTEAAAAPAAPAATAPWLTGQPSLSLSSAPDILTRRPLPPRPSGLTLVVVLAAVAGVIELIGGGLVVVGSSVARASQMSGHTMSTAPVAAPTILLGVGLFLLVLGVGTLVSGHFLSRGYNWARLTFMGLAALGIVANLAQTFSHPGQHVPIPQLLIQALVLAFLNGRATRDYCQR